MKHQNIITIIKELTVIAIQSTKGLMKPR